MYYLFRFNGHLWFLITLFTTQLLYILLYSLLARLPIIHKNVFLFLIALICHKYAISLGLPLIILKKAMEYLIYIHIGNVVAQKSAIIDKYITLTNLLYLIPTVVAVTIYIQHLPSLFIAFTYIIFFYIVAMFITQHSPNIHNHSYIKFISSNMFTIYLLHEPLVIGILKLLDFGHKFSPLTTVSILFFSTLIIVSLLTLSYNKIRFFTLIQQSKLSLPTVS